MWKSFHAMADTVAFRNTLQTQHPQNITPSRQLVRVALPGGDPPGTLPESRILMAKVNKRADHPNRP